MIARVCVNIRCLLLFCCLCVSGGGAISSQFSDVDLKGVRFEDCSLRAAPQPLTGAHSRRGGAISFVAGSLYVDSASFVRCTALPTTMSLDTCAERWDATSGWSAEGIGGSISAALSSVNLANVNASDGRACTG